MAAHAPVNGGVNLRARGTAGEDAALAAYGREGYALVARNWHFHRMGELDLILCREAPQPLLVFCEVKMRTDATFAAPAQAVGAAKQAVIRRLAAAFLQRYPQWSDRYVRFDVCEVVPDAGAAGGFRVSILENAFY